MSFANIFTSNLVVRAILKTLTFICCSFAAIFCASAAWGLSRMLVGAVNRGAASVNLR